MGITGSRSFMYNNRRYHYHVNRDTLACYLAPSLKYTGVIDTHTNQRLSAFPAEVAGSLRIIPADARLEIHQGERHAMLNDRYIIQMSRLKELHLIVPESTIHQPGSAFLQHNYTEDRKTYSRLYALPAKSGIQLGPGVHPIDKPLWLHDAVEVVIQDKAMLMPMVAEVKCKGCSPPPFPNFGSGAASMAILCNSGR